MTLTGQVRKRIITCIDWRGKVVMRVLYLHPLTRGNEGGGREGKGVREGREKREETRK